MSRIFFLILHENMGTRWNHLIEAISMSTTTYVYMEKKKNINTICLQTASYLELTVQG